MFVYTVRHYQKLKVYSAAQTAKRKWVKISLQNLTELTWLGKLKEHTRKECHLLYNTTSKRNYQDTGPPMEYNEDYVQYCNYLCVPSARILGGPDLHVDIGSTINLTCLIQFSPEPPAYIFWYHEDEVISYDSSRGGVSVVTEKGSATTSYLLVQDAAPADSGRYSCSPSNAEVASVRVHVLNGERPAAMQTGSAGLSNSSRCILALLVACVLHARLLRAQLAS
ncbi:unnamed protein product [Diatraea saccharalis]|uniref:Ig-like domain-containing protein n=1 Tax=Diatraea saccharalis TaxID=40085 RepID=A0A9N9RHE1_9NEOP|nr:unnamed protein product [Diatraea saccharalis]